MRARKTYNAIVEAWVIEFIGGPRDGDVHVFWGEPTDQIAVPGGLRRVASVGHLIPLDATFPVEWYARSPGRLPPNVMLAREMVERSILKPEQIAAAVAVRNRTLIPYRHG